MPAEAKNGKGQGIPSAADTKRLEPVLTEEQRVWREWVDLRGKWLASGCTGYFEGEELPVLGPKPDKPEPPHR